MYIYYLIFSTYQKIPLFSSKKIKTILLENINFYTKKYHAEIFSYSIIPCHLNLVISFKHIYDYLEFEQDFKSFTHKQIIKLINQNKINDYKFICGTGCGCKKINYHGPLTPRNKFTKETLNIIKKKNRIWRKKCWARLITNKKEFIIYKKYSYFNPVKHKLILLNNLKKYKYTYYQ